MYVHTKAFNKRTFPVNEIPLFERTFYVFTERTFYVTKC